MTSGFFSATAITTRTTVRAPFPQRRFWFDRVNGIRLARVQTFDDQGRLITDVSYSNEKTLGSSTTASLPSRIEITRPQDQYKLSISYQDSTSVELNRESNDRTVARCADGIGVSSATGW